MALHARIKSLKPTDQYIKPGAFWVGILKHHKLPSDDLEAEDCLWVKCGREKEVRRIFDAYCEIQKPEGRICFRHGATILNLDVVVASLKMAEDDTVVIEAILESQLPTRASAATPIISSIAPDDTDPKRTPLQDVTNTASALSRPANVKQEIVDDPSPAPARLFSEYPVLQNLDIAWVDFSCERMEIPHQVSSAEAMNRLIPEIVHTWVHLHETQVQYYIQRARKIASKTYAARCSNPLQQFAFSSRGFWVFYYARKRECPVDPHYTFETTQTFFDRVFIRWCGMNQATQNIYVTANKVLMERHPLPPNPRQSISRQTPAMAVPQDQMSGSRARSRSPSPSSNQSSDEEEDDRGSDENSLADVKADVSLASSRFNFPQLFRESSPEQLERGVERGVSILSQLQQILAKAGENDDTSQWLASIDNVAKMATRVKTVIGVVGNTGAGKSSILNALLEEERLLPTNCMRACTAVITEISYNYDSTAYSARIDFIGPDDWRTELQTLFKDLLDHSGNVSRECANEDSEAGIAYAKIKAVYPKLTKEDIALSSVDELMRHNNVARLLGSSMSIEEPECPVFYRKLQSYVDSKEKTTRASSDDDKKKKKPREMEFWPLIKVVRIYVRAPALSTGAVMVDLPGVHDSNQARAAVAQSYMKQCTGLWICAPINRAVDDKAAKSLLGDTFKRQLKMDGGYNTVTFVCSKTDDISLIEAQDSLGIEEELSELWFQCDQLDQTKRALKKDLEGLNDTKSDVSQAMETADEELDVWEKLKDDFEDGKSVYPPSIKTPNNKKRKVGRPRGRPAKKPRLHTSDDGDDDLIDDASDVEASDRASDDETFGNEEANRLPLTEEQIQTKVGDLRAVKKAGRQQRAQLDDSVKEIRSSITRIEKEHDSAEAIISRKCIQGRNEYSKGAIQQDFASGIKELDMEIQEEEDAANFNPENEVRDYDEVARSLPVFTVSSRAYQKLKGRLLKEKDVPGFETVEETYIPALQEHAKLLTVAGRQASCKQFLNRLSQVLNSLKLWASSDGSDSNLTELQKSQEAKILREKLGKLDKDLEAAIADICKALLEELQENVFDKFSAAVQQAAEDACTTAQRWGHPINRADRAAGGLYWATYKALCRRNGVFTNREGLHDWNAQLTDPIIKGIAHGWERTFARRIPLVLNGLANTNETLLNAFHKLVESRAMHNGTSIARLEMLKQQLPAYKATFKDLSTAAHTQITTRQKDINREFVPVVAAAMEQVYNDCESETGPGQYARMKAKMSRHVDGVRHQVFNDSTSAVKNSCKKLVKDIEDFLLTKADEVFISCKRDYEAVLLGRQAVTQQLPREQRELRSEVNDIVEGTELIFKRVVGLEPESPEEIQSGDGHAAEEPLGIHVDDVNTKIEPQSCIDREEVGASAIAPKLSQNSDEVTGNQGDANTSTRDATANDARSEPLAGPIHSSPLLNKASSVDADDKVGGQQPYTKSSGVKTWFEVPDVVMADASASASPAASETNESIAHAPTPVAEAVPAGASAEGGVGTSVRSEPADPCKQLGLADEADIDATRHESGSGIAPSSWLGSWFRGD